MFLSSVTNVEEKSCFADTHHCHWSSVMLIERASLGTRKIGGLRHAEPSTFSINESVSFVR